METKLVLYRKKKIQRDIVYLLGGYYQSKKSYEVRKSSYELKKVS